MPASTTSREQHPKLGAHDRRLLRALDAEWRAARELAERASYPRTQAPAALGRLVDAGAVDRQATELTGGRKRYLYRRAPQRG